MSVSVAPTPYPPYTPMSIEYTPITPDSTELDLPVDATIEQLLRAICHLIKRHARREKDILHLLEEAQRHNWNASVQSHLGEMRSWSDRISRVAGVALGILGALPEVSPEFVQWGIGKLAECNIMPNILERCNDVNMVAKVTSKIVLSARNVHDQVDKFNSARLKANETEKQSLGELFRDSYQKHSTALEQEKRTIEELLRTLEDVLKSKQQTQKTMMRG